MKIHLCCWQTQLYLRRYTYAADRMFPSILEGKYSVHPVGHILHHFDNYTPCCSSIQRIQKDKLLQSEQKKTLTSKSILLSVVPFRVSAEHLDFLEAFKNPFRCHDDWQLSHNMKLVKLSSWGEISFLLVFFHF